MKRRRFSAPEYQEDYLLNNSDFRPGWPGIQVHSFCHSMLLPDFRPNAGLYPFFLVSLILSGEDNFIDSDGDRIVRKPGYFAISDLNQINQKTIRRRHSLERYFVLIHVNRFLRDLLDRLFPAGLPRDHAPDPARLKRCFEDIRKVLRKPGKTDNVLLGAMGFRLLSEAAEQLSPATGRPDTLNRALAHIDNRFCDPDLNRADIAKAAGISVVTLGKQFQEHLHITMNHYICGLRLEKAVHLLEHTDLPVETIAGQCGFSYAYYFARVFRQRYGRTPVKYRAEQAEKPQSPA